MCSFNLLAFVAQQQLTVPTWEPGTFTAFWYWLQVCTGTVESVLIQSLTDTFFHCVTKYSRTQLLPYAMQVAIMPPCRISLQADGMKHPWELGQYPKRDCYSMDIAIIIHKGKN